MLYKKRDFMRICNNLLISIITVSFISFALPCARASSETGPVDYLRNAWGMEGALTNGNVSIGATNYDPRYSVGLFGAADIGDNNNHTQIYSIGVFGGPRYILLPRTYFAYGIDLTGNFGKKNGENLKNSYFVGPYIGIDYYLSTHVQLSGFINPYAYSHETIGNNSNSTHHVFSTGGIAISYLF